MTKYMMIGMAVLALALAGMTAAYLGKRDDLASAKAEHSAQMQIQINEVNKQIAQNLELRNDFNRQAADLSEMGATLTKERAEHERKQANLQRTLTTTQAAATRDPERFGRAFSILLRRDARNICRASGGDERTCKITSDRPRAAWASGPIPADVTRDKPGRGEGDSKTPAADIGSVSDK